MTAPFTFDDAVSALQNGIADLDSITNTLLTQLTLHERLSVLDGDTPFWKGMYAMSTEGYNRTPYIHGALKRLGIPGIRFSDGPRGCAMGQSTAFPVAMARGATWDLDLEERIGIVIGRECRAQGANFFGGPCINLARHPAWGGIQQTYSEDPILLGEMGAALTRGIQKNVMACVKHHGLNLIENARFQVDVEVDDATLHEVYLPHFRRIVEEGVSCVMSSYNSFRGEFAGQNKELLTGILRNQWGFQGFTVSDFIFGIRDAVTSLKSGLDIETPFQNLRARKLGDALETGQINLGDIDRACLAVLRGQIQDAARREINQPSVDVVFCDEHRKLAREAAVKSMVLLENQEVEGKPILPLSSDMRRLVVLGRLANSGETGDRGSSAVHCPRVISPYCGLKEALPNVDVILEDSEDIERVENVARSADVVVVIVGYDYRDEGEFTKPTLAENPALRDLLPPDDGSREARYVLDELEGKSGAESVRENGGDRLESAGDRESLRLRSKDVEIIKTAVKANPRTIVAIVSGGAVIMEEWRHLPAAIIQKGYSGCEGGRALASLLLGHENFSGRLPFSIPKSEEHLPFFDSHAMKITYDKWFGQRLLDKLGVVAAYPLGFGRSYTTFKISDLQVEQGKRPETLSVRVTVENAGLCKGRLVVQVYGVTDVPGWPRRLLLGFQSVDLEAQEERKIKIDASTRPLQRWDKGSWEMVSQEFGIEVGTYCGDEECVRTSHKM